MKKVANLVVYLCIVALGLATYHSATGLPEGLFGDIGAGTLPAALGSSLVGLALIGLVQEIKQPKVPYQFRTQHIKQWIVLIVLVVGFVAAWQFFGRFFLWLALFLFGAFSIFDPNRSRRQLAHNLMLAACLTIVAYILFEFALNVQFG